MSEGRTVMNVVDCASIPESRSAQEASLHRVLIVGAGAGGLELATRLGNTLGKRKKASIAILDKTRIRVWKPHLHEVASGTLDVHVDSIEYIAHACQIASNPSPPFLLIETHGDNASLS